MVRMQRDLGMGTLALLVTACMLFSVLSPAIVCWDDDVYADAGGSKPDFTYVSIGDSISNGYGMDGYYKEGDDINYRGFLQEVPQAYPSLIRDLLGESYDVNLIQLAVSGYRTAELRYLLDDGFESDIYTEKFGDNLENVENYLVKYYPHEDIPGEYTSASQYYRDMISRADLITYDLGTNDFGTFITSVVGANLGFTQWDEEFKDVDLSVYIGPEYGQMVQDLRAQFTAIIVDEMVQRGLDEGLSENVVKIVDVAAFAFAYGLIGFMINYDKTMELMYELNPDVDIIVVDIYNPISGVEFVYEDYVIPIGAAYGALLDLVNAYTKYLSPYAVKTGHADLTGVPDTFFDEMAVGELSSYDSKSALVTEFGFQDVVKQQLIDGGMSEDEASEKVEDMEFVYDFIDGDDGKVTTLLMEIANHDSIDIMSMIGGVDLDAVGEKVRGYILDGDSLTEGDRALAHIYLRAVVNDGLFIHPNADGHREFAEAIWDAYLTIDEPRGGWFEFYEAYLEGGYPAIKGYVDAFILEVKERAESIAIELKEFIERMKVEYADDIDAVNEVIDVLMDAKDLLVQNIGTAAAQFEQGCLPSDMVDIIDVEGIIGTLRGALLALDTEASGIALDFLDSEVFGYIMSGYDAVVETIILAEEFVIDILTYVDDDDVYYDTVEPLYIGPHIGDGSNYIPVVMPIRLMDIVAQLGGTGSDGLIYASGTLNEPDDLKALICDTNVVVFETDSGNIDIVLYDLMMSLMGSELPDLDFTRYSDIIGGPVSDWMDDMVVNLQPLIDALVEEYPDIEGMDTMALRAIEVMSYNYLGTFQSMVNANAMVKQYNSVATVVFTSIPNVFDGVSVSMGSIDVDLGEYYGYLVDVLNTLVREYCESTPLTLFVDISEAVDDSEVIIDEFTTKKIEGLIVKLNIDRNIVRDAVDDILADMDMLPFYTVTWKSYDGSVLSVQRVGDVEDARYNGPTPTRAMTDDIRYEWAGWSEPVMDSEGNMVLTAIFDEIPRKQYVEAEEGSDDVSFDIADIEREFIVAKNKGWDIQLPASLFTGSGTAKVSLKVLDKSALPDDVSDLAGDKKVISLDLTIDGEVISDFDGTGVTVSFEYVPTDGEDMSSIAVWYVNVNGKTLEKCDNARFDASSNRMVFDTTHFSYWVVGHVADDTPGHSIIGGYPLTVALVISILVLIGCVILVKVKR